MIEISDWMRFLTFLFCIYIAIQVSSWAKCIPHPIFIRRAVSIERKDLKIPFSSPKFRSPPLSLFYWMSADTRQSDRCSPQHLYLGLYIQRKRAIFQNVFMKNEPRVLYICILYRFCQQDTDERAINLVERIHFFCFLCDTHISRCKCDLPVGYISFYHHFEERNGHVVLIQIYTHWLDAAIQFWNSHFSQSKGFSLFDYKTKRRRINGFQSHRTCTWM